MDISALSQLSSIPSLLSTQQGTSTNGTGTSMFQDILGNLIGDANSTDSAFQSDIVQAAAGELSNPQQLEIDSTKAGIALQLVSNVRNDALTAYDDIIKMSV
jgi:flagellar hook-basal body complex protein FliE